MPKMLLCSLYDRVAQGYLQPFQQPNVETAKRSLRAALQQDQHLARNHQDLDVFLLGEFDTDSGDITPRKQHLFTLTSCKGGEDVQP